MDLSNIAVNNNTQANGRQSYLWRRKRPWLGSLWCVHPKDSCTHPHLQRRVTNRIACSEKMVPFRIHVPVSRYGSIMSCTCSQALFILSKAVSMPNSLPAFSATFSTMSTAFTKPASTSCCKVSACRFAGVDKMLTLAFSAKSSQWRSRIPGLRRAVIRGTLGRNSSTSSRT